MHILPAYLTDFWKQVPSVARSAVLWCNPRFSQLSRVLHFWRQYQCRGYVLVPHWVNTDWWPYLHSLNSEFWFDVPKGTHAFLGRHQSVSRPVPWDFHVVWLGDLSPCANSSSLDELPFGGLPHGGRSHGRGRRARARRARRLRLIHVNSYPPQPGGYLYPKSLGVHPPEAKCDLPLGQVAPPLSLPHLLRTAQDVCFPELNVLKSMYDCLSHRKCFVKLFSEDYMARHGVSSHLPAERLREAIEYGLITPLPRSTPIYFFHSNFLVMKSDRLHSRMISNVAFNEVQPSPPTAWECNLPSITHLIHSVLQWNFATELDARSFFPQFPLGPTVQSFFGLRQRHFRGVLRVMPQGWRWAPAIAQTTAHLLTYRLPMSVPDTTAAAFPWIDNFLLGASTAEAAQAILDAFIARCAFCHVTLKETSLTPSQHIVAIGVEFDLSKHRFRLAPEWADRAAPFLTAFIIELRTGYLVPLRTIWRAIGTCMWVASIHQLLLGSNMWEMIHYMKTHTPKESHRSAWDLLSTMSTAPLEEMARFADRLHKNPWLTQPVIPPAIATALLGPIVITDASLWAGAYLWATPLRALLLGQWWQWALRARRHNMPVLEALSLLRSLQELSSHGCLPAGQVLPWLTDCDPARRAVKRGYSPSPRLNRIVQAIRQFDVLLIALWIPTDLNITDPFSRRFDFVPPLTEVPITLQCTPLWAYVTAKNYTGVPPPPARRGLVAAMLA